MVVAEQCINCAYSGILAIRKVMTPTDILRLNTTHSAHTHIPEMSNYKQERAVSLQNDITEFLLNLVLSLHATQVCVDCLPHIFLLAFFKTLALCPPSLSSSPSVSLGSISF